MLTKRQYLEELGIDVWVQRVNMPVEPVRSESSRTNSENASPVSAAARVLEELRAGQPEEVTATTEVSTEQAQASHTKANVPNFRIAFLHYGEVGIAMLLDKGQKVPRRFCDDVARFMKGDPSSLRYQALDWPMVNNAAIDQSLNAAQEVVSQKFMKMPARIIVIGSQIAEYYGPVSRLEHLSPAQAGRNKMLLIESAQTVLNSVEEKRRLLSVLDSWD